MQSREVDLGDVLIESLTLGLGDLELERSGLARAIGTLYKLISRLFILIEKVTYSKGTSTPGATTVNLSQVGKLGKGGLVTQRDVEEAVVSEGAHGSNGGRLLATTEGTSGDEQTSVFAPEATRGPDTAGAVPEGLPLSGEVTVTGGDTEEDGIVVKESLVAGNRVGRLGGSVHLGENVLREGLRDSDEWLV